MIATGIDLTKRHAFFSLYSDADKVFGAKHARRLAACGVPILSAGGTCKWFIEKEGIATIDLKDVTGAGAAYGHKMLTAGRELFSAEISDMLNPDELAELLASMPFVDIAFYTFYDLKSAIARAASAPNRHAAAAIIAKATDFGGPAGSRASAKGWRAIATRYQEMNRITEEFERTGEISLDTRQELRERAEFEVAKYVGMSAEAQSRGRFHFIAGERVGKPLYGENPPQIPADQYSLCTDDPLAVDKFTTVDEGMPASHNNNSDMSRGLQTLTHMVAGFELNFGATPYAMVVAKHGNGCNAAMGFGSQEETVVRGAWCNRLSAFGGCAMFNFPLDDRLAELFVKESADDAQTKQFFDCVVAPGFSAGAVAAFQRKTGKCRIKANPALATHSGLLDTAMRFMYIRGGYQTQPNYTYVLDLADPELKTFGPALTQQQRVDVIIAWAIAATSNSNKIVAVRDGMLLGNGAGRQDRVGAAKLAVSIAIDAGHGTEVDPVAVATAAVKQAMAGKLGKRPNYKAIAKAAVESALNALATDRLPGAVFAGDSFFPFLDGVQVLVRAGAKVIFSTSGSKADAEVQQYCADWGVTLVQLPDKKARGFFGHSG